MSRRSSSKANTESRTTDEDGIRSSLETNVQSETTDEDGTGLSIRIAVRHVYGPGIVTTIARLDTKSRRVIIEDHYNESFTYTILPDANSIRLLQSFLTMAQKRLHLEQSA